MGGEKLTEFPTIKKKGTETYLFIFGMTCTQCHMKKLAYISTLCSSSIKFYGILLEYSETLLSQLWQQFLKLIMPPPQQHYLFILLPDCLLCEGIYCIYFTPRSVEHPSP